MHLKGKNKYSIAMVLIAIFLILGTFIIEFQDYATYISEDVNFDNVGEITAENIVEQDFICEYNNLSVIHILFSTNEGINTDKVVLELIGDDQCIQSWNINTKWIDSNYYLKLSLNHKLQSKDNKYRIRMVSDAQTGNGISAVCYKLEYSTLEHKSSYKPFILVLIMTILVSFAAWLFVQKKEFSIEKVFLILWCAFSMMYACSNSMFDVPDESHHFYRAFEISMGHMVSEMNDNQTKGGRELPLDTEYSFGKWQSFVDDRDARLSENTKFLGFSNTALYAPVSYIPQAVGILFARFVTDRIAVIAYAGRFFNWLCVTIILYFAIKLIPFGKEILALIALMPMNMHEAFSMAPDSMVVAISAFMVAFVMHLRYVQKTQLTKAQIVLLYVLALLISQYKIVYLPFCLVYFLIPKERFGGIKKIMIHAVVIASTVVMINILWLQTCNQFLTHVGANSELQMENILHHPINYCITVFRTYEKNVLNLLYPMVGSVLGQLTVPTNSILVFSFVFLLFHKMNYSFSGTVSKDTMIEKSIYAVIVLAIILLTSTSLYVQWTYVGEKVILGLQGRYFIALLLPFYYMITGTRYDKNRKERMSTTSLAVAMSFNACSCISLLFYCLK